MAQPPLPAVTLHDDPTLTVLQRANLLVCAWREAPTLEQMLVIGKHIERWRGLYGDRVAFVNVFTAGRLDKLSKDAREEANRLTARFPKNLCSAHVVLVSGMTGTLTRTILRAMSLVGGNVSPWRVFGTVRDAAPWVFKHLEGQASLVWTEADVLALLTRGAAAGPAHQ
jgi:hypothetical protein